MPAIDGPRDGAFRRPRGRRRARGPAARRECFVRLFPARLRASAFRLRGKRFGGPRAMSVAGQAEDAQSANATGVIRQPSADACPGSRQPQRVSPTSAPRRPSAWPGFSARAPAVRAAILHDAPGAGSISMVTTSTAAGGVRPGRAAAASAPRGSRTAPAGEGARARGRSVSRRCRRSARRRDRRFRRGRQRFEQPRKDGDHQQLDRPFELGDEPAHPGIGNERRGSIPRQALVRDAGRTEPRRQVGSGQCCEFADRRQPPPRQDVERPRGACRSAAGRTRSAGGRIKIGVDLGGELLKDGEWNVMQRLSRIAGRDGDASAGAGQQDRRGLRGGNRHLRRAGTREMLGYRARIAEQPLQAGHIEHDRAAGTAFDARRKVARDRHQPIDRCPIGLVQGGVELAGV